MIKMNDSDAACILVDDCIYLDMKATTQIVNPVTLRILVVDDYPTAAESLAEMLRLLGHDVRG